MVKLIIKIYKEEYEPDCNTAEYETMVSPKLSTREYELIAYGLLFEDNWDIEKSVVSFTVEETEI